MSQRPRVDKGLGSTSPQVVTTSQTLPPRAGRRKTVHSIQTPTSAWISTLSEFLVFVKEAFKIVAFTLVQLIPVAYGADGTIGNGDEFSNNLFSDLAPLMTLFGEQVTKQFISQSMGWADNILLAMAPLGILTIMVSAIRVGGEQWLKNIIGRARESDGLAEAELMSSTSSDVCELWGGRGVVRVLGSPDLMELVYTVDGDGDFTGGSQDMVYRGVSWGIYDLAGAINGRLCSLKSRKGPEKPTAVKEPPNLVLNVCGSGVGERELWVYAILGVISQILVWAWCILAVTFFKYGKGGGAVKPYGLPVTVTGSLFVCLGILLCSHVVEASTTEHVYGKVDNARTVFLQRGGQMVNDQRFEGYAIFPPQGQKEIKTSRKNEVNLGFFVNLGTALALVGFVAQFIGLRAMHWSCTIAQLLATLAMTILRATARRGLSTIVDATPVTEGYELQWLAMHLNRSDRWSIETGLIDPSREGKANLSDQTGKNSAERVVSLLENLYVITNWERPLRKLAISTGRAMENILNIITTDKDIITVSNFSEISIISCKFPVNCNGSSTFIDFEVKRVKDLPEGWRPWVADIARLEAILGLWMLSQNQAEKDWDIASEALEYLERSDFEANIDSFLQQARETVLPREPKYDQHRIDRQRIYTSVVRRREGMRCTDFMQILGRFSKQQVHDYETWMELRGKHGGYDKRMVSTRHLVGPLEAHGWVGDFRSLGPERPWHTYFGFGLDAYSDREAGAPGPSNSTGDPAEYLVAVTEASKSDILGLDLVAKFMWEASECILTIHGVTRRRIINLEESKNALVNSVLHKLAQSITEVGLGELQDAYNILIPPLSAAGKLPTEDISVAEGVVEV